MLTKRKILVVIGIIVALLITFYTGIFGMSVTSLKTPDFANKGSFVDKPGMRCPSLPGFYKFCKHTVSDGLFAPVPPGARFSKGTGNGIF